MSRNVIGYLLEIISRIAHRNTNACLPDDGNIIAAIAESHGFIYVQTQIISHRMQALTLIRIGCRNIRKGRMPPARSAVAERRHQERLLLYRTERSNLQNLLISQFIHIGQEDFTIHPQSLGKDFINLVGIMMDSEMMLSYDDCRIIITVGCLDNLLYIFRKDGVLAHHLIAYKTAGSIGGDVTVDEMFYLTEVSNEELRTTGRNIHLYPILLSLLQGIYRTLRNLVGLETHQGAVNIEKQCFYLLIHTNIFYTLLYIMQNRLCKYRKTDAKIRKNR